MDTRLLELIACAREQVRLEDERKAAEQAAAQAEEERAFQKALDEFMAEVLPLLPEAVHPYVSYITVQERGWETPKLARPGIWENASKLAITCPDIIRITVHCEKHFVANGQPWEWCVNRYSVPRFTLGVDGNSVQLACTETFTDIGRALLFAYESEQERRKLAEQAERASSELRAPAPPEAPRTIEDAIREIVCDELLRHYSD